MFSLKGEASPQLQPCVHVRQQTLSCKVISLFRRSSKFLNLKIFLINSISYNALCKSQKAGFYPQTPSLPSLFNANSLAGNFRNRKLEDKTKQSKTKQPDIFFPISQMGKSKYKKKTQISIFFRRVENATPNICYQVHLN